MSNSTLDPENAFQRDRQLGKGHGTAALGPSDTSDSGSDVSAGDAGADLGDAMLASDTDAGGTGERTGIGRDGVTLDADIGVDQIVRLDAQGNLIAHDDEAIDEDLQHVHADRLMTD